MTFSRQEWERIARDGPGVPVRAPRFTPIGVDLAPDAAVVVVVSRALAAEVLASLGVLAREFEHAALAAVILVPWKAAPASGTRYDSTVDSFMCDASTYRKALARAGSCEPVSSCFALLDGVLSRQIHVDRIVVRQIPLATAPPPQSFERATLVMAHRGDPSHLRAALRFIAAADHAEDLTVRVGLDVDDLDAYRAIRDEFPSVTFFEVRPAPAGLFVIRQHLLEIATEGLFCLHDSDDVSCSDRFVAQIGELHRHGCDVLGCHELRVDETTGRVEAHRLPLDVHEALGAGYSECLLNGTAVGIRRAILDAGGYSTDRSIANDTQFMLRGYFLLRMRNIDGFYYLRRRHKAALTMAPETGLGTPLREGLRAMWAADFDAVQAGTLELADSSLRRMTSKIDYTLREWAAP